MDVLQQIIALVGISLVGAGQPLERSPVFRRSAQIALILAAVVHESGSHPLW